MRRFLRAAAEAAGILALVCGMSVVVAASGLALLCLPLQFDDPMARLAIGATELIVGVWAIVTLAFWRASDE